MDVRLAPVVTSNVASPSLFPPDPAIASVRWRGMRDVATLYRFHLARVERLRGGRTIKLFHDPMQYVLDGNRRTMRRMVEKGYFVLDAGAGVYRKTLKGCLLTYRMFWPWKGFIASRFDRTFRAELAICGMGRPEEYAMQPVGFSEDPMLDYDGSVTVHDN